MRTRPPVTVLIDTSFILTMLKNHKEFGEEIRDISAGPVRLATTDGVVMELQRLSRSGSFDTAGLAKIALAALEKRRIDVLESSPGIPEVDSSILAIALATKDAAAVATVDRRLRHALLKHGLKTISPRGRGGLVISSSRHSVPLK